MDKERRQSLASSSVARKNLPLLSERMSSIDSSAIRRIFDLSAKLEDPINLSIGQPHFRMPEPICEALAKALREGKTAYTQTQGILELREALSQKCKTKNGFQVHPDQLLISSGVSSLIQLLFMVTLEPGDRILLTDPFFLIYKSLADFFGARTSFIPENFAEEDVQKQDLESLKLIIISTPSNPTGHIQSKKQIQLLANLAEQSGALLVSDEIYELYDYEQSFQSPASLYPSTLTLSGFSKSYSMTGLRLGAAAGPPGIIKAMTRLQQYTVVCAPTPVQFAGLAALDLDMSSYIRTYKKNRDYCIDALEGLLPFHYPAGAFYIFAEVPEEDQIFIERAIKEKKLLLVPGRIFSDSRRHVRISYAVDRPILERGIQALKELLS